MFGETIRNAVIGMSIVGGFNTMIQIRMFFLLSPLADELSLLADELSSLNTQASQTVEEAEMRLREVISASRMARKIVVPSAARLFFGIPGSLLVTAYNINALAIIARAAISTCVNGVKHDDGVRYFGFSGTPYLSSVWKAFFGGLNPARDLANVRYFVESWKEGDLRSAHHDFVQTAVSLGKYGDFRGEFGFRNSLIVSGSYIGGGGEVSFVTGSGGAKIVYSGSIRGIL